MTSRIRHIKENNNFKTEYSIIGRGENRILMVNYHLGKRIIRARLGKYFGKIELKEMLGKMQQRTKKEIKAIEKVENVKLDYVIFEWSIRPGSGLCLFKCHLFRPESRISAEFEKFKKE